VKVPLLDSPASLSALLAGARTLAVVGLSADPSRDSNSVSAYMKSHGYRVIGVNPRYPKALGEPLVPSLSALSEKDLRAVGLVVVFRRPEESAAVAREAAGLKIPAIWFQLGVATPEAIAEAERGGMNVVADKCIMVVHRVLGRHLGAKP
jgi:predicted CoA-binding protein